ELEKAALSASSPGGWLVLSGSLPPRCPPDVYARFATAARALEARVAVDTSGPPLTEAVGKGPDLIKPNLEEFQELVARPTRTVREALEACRWLQEAGVGTVLLSMGDRGALLVGADSVLYGFAAVSDVRNTVGAGDALLAGFLAAEDPRRNGCDERWRGRRRRCAHPPPRWLHSPTKTSPVSESSPMSIPTRRC